MYVSSLLLLSEHMWHKAFLMGYSMRLELTLVSSINDLWLVKLVYIGVVVPLSWSVFTLVCFKNKINKFKKYKSLHGPSYFKIYPYSFFGPITTIFIYNEVIFDFFFMILTEILHNIYEFKRNLEYLPVGSFSAINKRRVIFSIWPFINSC